MESCPKCGWELSKQTIPVDNRIRIRQALLLGFLSAVDSLPRAERTTEALANQLFAGDPARVLRARGVLHYLKKQGLIHDTATPSPFWIITKPGGVALRRMRKGQPWKR